MFLCKFEMPNVYLRAAMTEFEINMSEMPLGKLSKGNIQQGDSAMNNDNFIHPLCYTRKRSLAVIIQQG